MEGRGDEWREGWRMRRHMMVNGGRGGGEGEEMLIGGKMGNDWGEMIGDEGIVHEWEGKRW